MKDKPTAMVKPKDILARVSSALYLEVPANWFDNLPRHHSVFESLYQWIAAQRSLEARSLHAITYVSASLQKRLLLAERKRLSQVRRLSGEKLEQAVGWSNAGSGPLELFAGKPIAGDGLLVFPEGLDNAARDMERELIQGAHQTAVRRIRDHASGRNFREWLNANVGREDPVGDLASEIGSDPHFPSSDEFFILHRYLLGFSPSWEAVDALENAWLEYAERYPSRTNAAPRCAHCLQPYIWQTADGTQINGFEPPLVDIADGVFAWRPDGEEAFFYHSGCYDREAEAERALFVTALRNLTGYSARESFQELASRAKMEPDAQADAEKVLRLAGFRVESGGSRIYFVQSSDSGLIKIGLTTRDVQRRLADFKTSHPGELRILAQMKGDRATEQDLHRRFATHRRAGEWFEPHPDIIAFIAVLVRGV